MLLPSLRLSHEHAVQSRLGVLEPYVQDIILRVNNRYCSSNVYPALYSDITVASNTATSMRSLESSCILHPQTPLLAFISDKILSIVLPTVISIVITAAFHIFDVYNILSSHRTYPSGDALKRN